MVTPMNDLSEKHPDVVFVYPIQIALFGQYVGKEAPPKKLVNSSEDDDGDSIQLHAGGAAFRFAWRVA